MNVIEERIFKNKKPDFNRLEKSGFVKTGGVYVKDYEISDGQFSLSVKVGADGIDTKVLDISTGEPYTLFLVGGATGSFVGEVRTAYESVLNFLAESCFDDFIFKSGYAQAVIGYVREKYGGELEFLWDKFTDCAVWRRDGKKWYGLLTTVKRSKLGDFSDEAVEVINLHADPEDVKRQVDGKVIFGGYHMNKKHWITVCLDGSLPLEDICKMIDISYDLAKK